MIKRSRKAAAFLLLAVMIASLAACGTKVETGGMLDTNIARIYRKDERASMFVKNGEVIDGSAKGMAYLDIAAGGNTALAWVDNIVYFVSDNGVDLLGKGVDFAEISFDGRFAFYLLDGVLWRFAEATRTAEPVAEGVVSVKQLAVSPGGESAVFTATFEGEGAVYRNTLIKGVSVSSLADIPGIVVAVSDSADIIYYYQPSDGKLCVVKNGETKVVSEDCGLTSNFNFTSDLSEVTYSTESKENRLFRLRDGLDVLLCEGFGFTLKTDVYSMATETVPVYINDVKTFTNGLFLKRAQTSDGYRYDVGVINAKGGIKWLIRGAEDYRIAYGNKRVIWSEDGNLNSTSFGGRTKKLASDVRSYEVLDDGKTVYYISTAGTLFEVKGTGKPKKIDEDVDSAAAISGGVAYIKGRLSGKTEVGRLIFMKDGEKLEIKDNAAKFDKRKGQLLVLTDPHGDDDALLYTVFVTVNGTELIKVGENVEP